jgi:uncharacterized protein
MPIVFPVDTALCGGWLGFMYLTLTVWIMASRTASGTLQGSGGDDALQKRIRAHANFGEYVPLALVLIGLWEAGGGHHGRVLTALWLLVLGRLLHPFGLFAAPGSPPQFACRGGGMLLTLIAIAMAAIGLLHDFT